MKRILSLAITAALLISLFSLSAYAEQEEPETPRSYAAEEVIYALLSAGGQPEELMAVVILEALKQTRAEYYGDFSQIKNLSDTRELILEKNRAEIELNKGKFFFQGDLNRAELPWLIDIEYSLDGRRIEPEELGGKSGRLEIYIETEKNPKADAAFFEAYLLQISVTLDMQLCSNIEAQGATTANSGGSKLINFMVMPGAEGSLKLAADVEDFSMPAMTISGIPYSMADSLEGVEDITAGLGQLVAAIGQLNTGAASLSDGAGQLGSGAAQFGSGLTELSKGSSQLVDGSSQILEGLRQISDLVAVIGELSQSIDLSSLQFLPPVLKRIADGLDAAAGAMEGTEGNMEGAIDSVSQALDGLASITEEELEALQQANPDSEALRLLIENYRLALAARDIWDAAVESFRQAAGSADEYVVQIRASAKTARELAESMQSFLDSGGLGEVSSFIDGLAGFAGEYEKFHNGLVEYTGGVDALAAAWPELYSGIVQLGGGTEQLADGTGQLNAGTSAIPEQIDQMLSSYTGGDFEERSFLSEKNENTVLVQFVMATGAIEAPDQTETAGNENSDKSGFELFVERLTALFRPEKT